MERLFRIGLVLLVLSLAFNIALISRVNRLDNLINNRFNMLQNEWQRVSASAQQSAERVNQVMTLMEAEQRWITPVNITPGQQTDGRPAVKLSWVIKDYPGDAPVTFHYRKQNDTEFVSLPAKNTGGGRFEVELTENLETGPQWKFGVSYIEGENGRSKSMNAIEEARAVEGDNIDYYISVRDGDRLKSNEIGTLSLNDVSESLYTGLSAEVMVNLREERYLVNLTEHVKDIRRVKIARVFLEATSGDKPVDQKELVPDKTKPDGSLRAFTGQWDFTGLTFDRVALKVEYENGEQFAKDITGRP